MSTNLDATTAHDPAERYKTALDLATISLGDGTTLMYCPIARSTQVISSADAALLDRCRDFATLDQHKTKLAAQLRLDPQRSQGIKESLDQFATSGLLVSERALVRKCLPHGETVYRVGAGITTLGVPTRDRSANLRRCLESYAVSARSHGGKIEFVVVDESVNASEQRSNVETLEMLTKEFGLACSYIDRAHKAQAARELAQAADVDPQIVDFAFVNDEHCSIDVGGSRNILLLRSVGELAVQVDDDTVCEVAQAPTFRSGLELTSKFDPTKTWFPSECESASPGEPDFFALHERLLGLPVTAQVNQHIAETLEIDTANATFFRRLENRRGNISVTALGMAGDSGMVSPEYFLRLEGDSRALLTRSQNDYHLTLQNQQIVRCVNIPTISEASYCMALNIGLDNRRLLPPFMPVQRNEDAIFGALLHVISGGDYFGFLPWVIKHRWAEPGRASTDLVHRASNIYCGDIFYLMIRSFTALGSTRPESTLIALGRWLHNWGCASPAEFNEFLRHLLWRRASQQVSLYETLLQKYGRQPVYWAVDVQNYVNALCKAIPAKQYIVPCDLSETFGAEQASIVLRRLVRRFGELLQCWPQLRDAAHKLRLDGWHPGRKI